MTMSSLSSKRNQFQLPLPPEGKIIFLTIKTTEETCLHPKNLLRSLQQAKPPKTCLGTMMMSSLSLQNQANPQLKTKRNYLMTLIEACISFKKITEKVIILYLWLLWSLRTSFLSVFTFWLSPFLMFFRFLSVIMSLVILLRMRTMMMRIGNLTVRAKYLHFSS